MAGQGVRKRGGQPGNDNAVKHGFYSPRFTSAENLDLDAAAPVGVSDEIALLRVGMRRLFELAQEGETAPGAAEWAAVLDALGVAAVRISGLLRTQKLIEGGQSKLSDALSTALSEVCGEIACGKS